ncbi:DUF808 domain-containing protein [Neptuniibacter sp. QD37_11]|uniref:DUF808 domain-containing protein n=1 Tax=Neptuniibacter sp. QD37_11 TaxID=3398209 RepID=UPI0039F56828
MAGTGLLALLDDITVLLDDISAMTKLAGSKVGGVIADDVALNAEQATGVKAERELPVVWAIAKGSMFNKVLLVPGALALSYYIPWLIMPLLMLGGMFLCFEGVEKLAHKFLHSKEEDNAHHEALVNAINDESVDMVEWERKKIKGAIRTDMILSGEIIIITLGAIAGATFIEQLGTLVAISILITVGVYGLVAGLVKLDDVGLHYINKPDTAKMVGVQRAIGRKLLAFAPKMMKTLSVVGTAAMFMVGGGILAHGVPAIHHAIEAIALTMADIQTVGFVLEFLVATSLEAICGIVAGAVAVGVFEGGCKFFGKGSVESTA